MSMEPVPGAMAKVEFDGSAVTRPAEQPAARSSAGAKSIARIRIGSLRTDSFPLREPGELAWRIEPIFVTCIMRSNSSGALLGVLN